MILAIDTGNTRTILGCLDDDGNVVKTVQIGTNVGETSYEFAARMKQVMELAGIALTGFDGAIISCVVPSLTMMLDEAVRMITGLSPMILGAGIKTGLDIRLDDPGSIAGDLVASAVGAKQFYPLPCIIIDMSTATTVTVVNSAGAYIGGCIMPGARISLDALTSNAALLPVIDFLPPKKVIGSNTVDAMRGGIIFGCAGALDGIIDRFQEQLDTPASIIATGGLGELITPYCRHEIIIDNHLLLRGLGVIYRKNRAQGARKR